MRGFVVAVVSVAVVLRGAVLLGAASAAGGVGLVASGDVGAVGCVGWFGCGLGRSAESHGARPLIQSARHTAANTSRRALKAVLPRLRRAMAASLTEQGATSQCQLG